MPATLTMRAYEDDYYTWDAKKDYWYNHKDDQPKGSNYPTETDVERWFNGIKFPTAASNSAKDCPNANELTWYCMKGDPHWDNTTLWTVWKHLYTGGMWFKKKNVIISDCGISPTKFTEESVDGKKRATTKTWDSPVPPSNKFPKKGTPNKLSDYFFLPAMGNYAGGKLKEFREYGFYWTKTPEPYFDGRAYNLFFNDKEAGLSNISDRENGYKLWTSQ